MSNLSVKEVLKNVDLDEETNKDLLLRQSKMIYPDVEEWVLKMAVEAYINELKQGTHSPSE